jgi:adenosine deaminase CECR1
MTKWTSYNLKQARTGIAGQSIGSIAIFAGGYSLLNGQQPSDQVDIFDTALGRHAATKLSQSRAYLASAVEGNQVYFAGGQTATSKTAAIESYDVNRRSWREVSLSLSQSRSHLAAASLHGWLYYAGGVNDAGQVLDTVDMIQPSSGQHVISRLSSARHSLTATSVAERYILFAGGAEGAAESSIIDVFDTVTRTWSNMTLGVARSNFAACAVGSLFVAAGGRSQGVAVADTFAFDFATQQPVATNSLSSARYDLDCTVVGSMVFFGGGTDGTSPSTTVDVYNAMTDMWSVVNLSSARSQLSIVATTNNVLFAGGITSNGDVTDAVEALRLADRSVNVPIDPPLTRLPSPFDTTLIAECDPNFYRQRHEWFMQENDMDFAANETLTAQEEIVSQYMYLLKLEEFRNNFEYYPPAQYFLNPRVRRLIEASPLLPIITDMPKGAHLHIHISGVADARWMINMAMNSTYKDWLWVRIALDDEEFEEDYNLVHVSPENPDPTVYSSLLHGDHGHTVEELVDRMALQEALISEDQDHQIWRRFQRCFNELQQLFRFKPFYINVINRILSDSVDEHVQYIEYRHEPGKVFEIVEGRLKRIGEAGELELLTSLVDDFKATHKNFFGVKLIWPTQRGGSAVVSALQNTAKFANIYPNFVIGYDLLGQEDKGFSLLRNIDMIDGLLANLTAANTTFSKFYHSGESAWPGDVNPSSRPGDSSPDANLFDAILVDTRRIGHGFALFKHPVLLDKIKQRDIALEVCPISNQILGYAQDLRTHPAIGYMKSGLQVVLSSDDPGIFRYRGVSYDFWEAYMAWGLGLRGLKKLARNSLQYSMLIGQERAEQLSSWETQWHAWVDEMQVKACEMNISAVSPFETLLSPACGPRTGGYHVILPSTRVTRQLTLCSQFQCNFGTVSTSGQVLFANQIKCYVPAHAKSGNVPISVTYDGVKFDLGIDFQYFDEEQRMTPVTTPHVIVPVATPDSETSVGHVSTRISGWLSLSVLFLLLAQ